MGKKICILGSGRQGTAAGYDLIRFLPDCDLTFADIDIKQAQKASERVQKLLGKKTNIAQIDLMDKSNFCNFLDPFDIFLSSVPYKFNVYLTDIAVATKTSMVDLGGHTLNVRKQLLKNSDAKDAGITIVPDCGMGPGMNVSVAMMGIESMDNPKEVYVWDGGLPLQPIEPWNYALFFNIAGLTNEYDGSAFFIENGIVSEVSCFEYIEKLQFDNMGELEAAVTSGGLSTMPWTYEGKLEVLHNKTLRYCGHWEQMRAFRDLGLFEEKEVEYNGRNISPRDFYHSLLEPKLIQENVKDICLMRVKTIGTDNGMSKTTIIDIVEEYDSKTGFLAMEKWTGWHASIVMIEILNGNIGKGAFSIETALSGKTFHEKALMRSYDIKVKQF
tara:strand:- start:932 stop:2089 length:1158 start_codon:yes stop_codon:yes gene_type:complete